MTTPIMNAPKTIMTHWRQTLKHSAGTRLAGHQLNALAAFTWALARQGHCHLSRVALVPINAAKPRSRERRWQRLLNNTRLDVAAVRAAVLRTCLQTWRGARLLLLLDETPLKNALRCLKVSVACRRRALPLTWCVYPTHQPPAPRAALITRLLREVAAILPPSEVVLMADRGLSDPHLIDQAVQFGWHYLLRVQHQTQLRLADQTGCSIGELQHKHGGWFGAAQAFKKAHWRSVNVVVVPGQASPEPAATEAGGTQKPPDPWLLVTDLEPTRRCCGLYRRRMWQEESFRDEKSGGLHWDQSHVRLPAHMDRLLLGMTLAYVLLVLLGLWGIKRGRRRWFEPTTRRLLSVFQLGWRYLVTYLSETNPVPTKPPLRLQLPPCRPRRQTLI